MKLGTRKVNKSDGATQSSGKNLMIDRLSLLNSAIIKFN